MFSPESLLRTQLAMRDEAMRIHLSPLPRVATRVPQTQSAFFSASSICGKSLDVLQIGIKRCDVLTTGPRMPAQLAADRRSWILNAGCAAPGSLAASSFKTLHEWSVLQSSVTTTSLVQRERIERRMNS